jgi:hypothetical protein
MPWDWRSVHLKDWPPGRERSTSFPGTGTGSFHGNLGAGVLADGKTVVWDMETLMFLAGVTISWMEAESSGEHLGSERIDIS